MSISTSVWVNAVRHGSNCFDKGYVIVSLCSRDLGNCGPYLYNIATQDVRLAPGLTVCSLRESIKSPKSYKNVNSLSLAQTPQPPLKM